MKEQILQIVLKNKENKEDIVKIRLVENSKANVAKILKKIGTQTYQIKKIRIKDHRVIDVLRVQKLNRKVLRFITDEEAFELDLRKSKNQLLERIMKVFTIKNECFLLKEKVKNFKEGLIGVVINSELFIKEDPKIDNLYMNLIVWKGLRRSINIQGILIKDHDNIKVELISELGVKVKDNTKYLVFSNRYNKFPFFVDNKDQLTKTLSFSWEYIFGQITDKIK